MDESKYKGQDKYCVLPSSENDYTSVAIITDENSISRIDAKGYIINEQSTYEQSTYEQPTKKASLSDFE